MSILRQLINRVNAREDGATAVEYGIMVALISAVIVAVVLVLGSQVKEGFCTTSNTMAPAIGTGVGTAAGC